MVFTTELLDFRRETILYLVLGPLALLLNIPIVVLILSSRTLRIRKEFIMIIGLCLVDATCGLAYTSTGIYRLRLIDSHRLEEITSRFFCNKTFGQVVLIQFDQLMSCIVVVTTLDRAFAIFKPIAYFKLSPFYAWKVVLFVFLQAAFFYVLSHILTMDNEAAEVSALCYTSDSVDATFYDVLRGIRIVSVTISIVMYIPIGIRLIYFAKHQSEVNFSSSRFKQLKTMTITVVIATSTDTVFILIPDVVLAANLFGLARHAMFFYLLNLSKCSLNVFIFSWRHKEILEEIRLRLGQLKSRKVKRINRISSENFKIRSSEAITKF